MPGKHNNPTKMDKPANGWSWQKTYGWLTVKN